MLDQSDKSCLFIFSETFHKIIKMFTLDNKNQ